MNMESLKYLSNTTWKIDAQTDTGRELVFVKVYEAKKGELWKASRAWCKYMKPEEVPEALKRFVSSNPSAEKGYDGAFARAVYGAALKELQNLKAWYIPVPIPVLQYLLSMRTTHYYTITVETCYRCQTDCHQPLQASND